MIKVYLAGKISKNDWRHRLVRGLREHDWSSGDIDCGGFIYVGPYFVSCDHGCNHGRGQHGALLGEESICGGDQPHSFREVSDRAAAAVLSADLIFCFAETTDCLGSMYEFGLADAPRTPVVLCVKNGLDAAEFRFVGSRPHVVLYDGVKETDLPKLLADAIDLITVAKRRWMK